MTLEEAIIQFKEDAENNRVDLDLEWAEENEQVAKWLEELKDYRDKNKMVVKVDVMNIQELKDKILEAYEQGRAEAEETYLKLITEIDLLNASDMSEVNLYKFACRVKEIADALKEQNK